MAHHHHHHDHSDRRGGLALAFWLNAGFCIVELVGGILTNSTAILTDAIHDFGDTLAIGAGILLEKQAAKPRSKRFSYGYKRFSLLSALVLSLILAIGSVVMLVKAIWVLQDPQPVNSTGMLGLAVLGIAVNGAAFLNLRKEKAHSHNSKAIMLHLLEDVLGWAAVLIGAVVIRFTGWYIVDPLLSIAIACYILFNAGRNLIDTLKILLQSVPDDVDTALLTSELKHIDGVSDVHDLHIWSLDVQYTVGTLHVVVEETRWESCGTIMTEAVSILKRHGIQHPTIQLEKKDDLCVSCSEEHDHDHNHDHNHDSSHHHHH